MGENRVPIAYFSDAHAVGHAHHIMIAVICGFTTIMVEYVEVGVHNGCERCNVVLERMIKERHHVDVSWRPSLQRLNILAEAPVEPLVRDRKTQVS
ncbi:hypothetical protein D3C71_1218620 [compost metagenome]